MGRPSHVARMGRITLFGRRAVHLVMQRVVSAKAWLWTRRFSRQSITVKTWVRSKASPYEITPL